MHRPLYFIVFSTVVFLCGCRVPSEPGITSASETVFLAAHPLPPVTATMARQLIADVWGPNAGQVEVLEHKVFPDMSSQVWKLQAGKQLYSVTGDPVYGWSACLTHWQNLPTLNQHTPEQARQVLQQVARRRWGSVYERMVWKLQPRPMPLQLPPGGPQPSEPKGFEFVACEELTPDVLTGNWMSASAGPAGVVSYMEIRPPNHMEPSKVRVSRNRAIRIARRVAAADPEAPKSLRLKCARLSLWGAGVADHGPEWIVEFEGNSLIEINAMNGKQIIPDMGGLSG
ncbi:MAG: hypothetical protein ABFE08_07325 [Armatimonadia bacterium]